MAVRWADLAFVPDPNLAAEISAAWQWLVAGQWSPFLCSMIGGIFFEDMGGEVLWLESGTGLVERVAANRAEFDEFARSNAELVDEWFLPPLVERLLDAGKRPAPGECYAFIYLPVFVEGKYEPDNMIVVRFGSN